VLGISNPSHPVLVGSLTDNSLSGAYRLRVRGNFAYIAASSVSTIAALDISDPTHPRIAASLQDSAHLNTTIGLDLDSSGQHVIASSPRLASEGTRNVPPFPVETGTVSVIDLQAAPQSTSPPTISGSAIQGAQLIATPGGWFGYPSPAFTYGWQRCNVNGALCHAIAGATSASYVTRAVDVGASLRVLVGAANRGGVSSATSAATTVIKPNATAALTGLARGRPNLRMKVVAPSSRAPVKRIVIALPGGLSFARSGSTLTKGIVVKDGRGRRLRFTAGIVRGSLVIVLRASAASVQLTAGPASISVSTGLEQKVKHKRKRKLRVGIVFFDTRHGTHRSSVLAPAT
jgi:LVIVD repeat